MAAGRDDPKAQLKAAVFKVERLLGASGGEETVDHKFAPISGYSTVMQS